jgi:hypothetical protein
MGTPVITSARATQMTIGIRTVSSEGLFGCDELVYGLIHEYRIVAWAG